MRKGLSGHLNVQLYYNLLIKRSKPNYTPSMYLIIDLSKLNFKLPLTFDRIQENRIKAKKIRLN